MVQNKKPIKINFNDFHLKKTKNTKLKVYGYGGGAICEEIINWLSYKVIGLPNASLIKDENEFSIEHHLNSRSIIISGIIAEPNEKFNPLKSS